MTARRAFVFAGSLWELARFFVVLSILDLLFGPAGAKGFPTAPWLLLGGTGNLLVAVGGIMLSLFPGRYEAFLGLLRLGKAFGLFAFILLPVSGALNQAAGRELAGLGRLSVTLASALAVIFMLDLLFFAALLACRREDAGELPEVDRSALQRDVH